MPPPPQLQEQMGRIHVPKISCKGVLFTHLKTPVTHASAFKAGPGGGLTPAI